MNKTECNIICSNLHYFYYDTDFFFEKMKENGFSCVEMYAGTPHIFIDRKSIDDFSQVKKSADEAGVRITDVRPETMSFRYHLCSLDDEWNESSLAAYKNVIDFAATIGAGSMNTNISGAFRDCAYEIVFDRVCENLKILADYAEKRNIFLTVESESGDNQGFIRTAEQLMNVKKRVASEALRFGINTDALAESGESLGEWKKVFGDKIRYIRFSSLESYLSLRREVTDEKMESADKIFFLMDDKYLDKPQEADRELKENIWD